MSLEGAKMGKRKGLERCFCHLLLVCEQEEEALVELAKLA